MPKAMIFDMDGLLIDSEPFWHKSHIEVLQSVGVSGITEDMVRQVAGFRPTEAINHWYKLYAWSSPSVEDITKKLVSNVEKLIKKEGAALPGAVETLKAVSDKNIPVAIASSSPEKLIKVVIDKLDIARYINLIHSGEFEPYGKPHPGIFITTAKKLGVSVEDCLVFEDSFNGVLAAKAAKMKCIAVPEKKNLSDKRFCIADLVLESLNKWSYNHWI